MIKTTGEFIKEKRISEGLSLREASKLSGVSHTHIRDIENGRSVPSFEMVITFLRAYAIEMEDFLRETGHLSPELEPEESAKIKRVPILSWTQAGHWRECANSQDYDCAMIETDSRGTFALSVRGDSMEPEFHEDDIIIIHPYLKPEHNDYIVICNPDWEATFKQLKKYGKTRVLHPLNTKYEDIELKTDMEYRVVGVVVEKKKKYR